MWNQATTDLPICWKGDHMLPRCGSLQVTEIEEDEIPIKGDYCIANIVQSVVEKYLLFF